MLNRKLMEFKDPEVHRDANLNNLIRVDNKNEVLKKANQVILKQQMAIIEEQRLNILFQMLGITLHELNQPLTSLLGNIELMVLNQNDPDKLKENIRRVVEAGKRFSGIIRKIQNIRQGKTLIQDSLFCPMKTNKQWKFLALVSHEKIANKIESVIKEIDNVELLFHENGLKTVDLNPYNAIDLVITDEKFMAEFETSIIREIKKQNNELPILALFGSMCEETAFHLIQDGLDDYYPVSGFNKKTILHVLNHMKEKARLRHQLNSAFNDLAGMSVQDEQTGLFQRKFFRDALEREITKTKRRDESCVIGKVDVNDFLSEIQNDENGNATPILKDISKIIQDKLSARHLVCRYGHTSFAFILSNTSSEAAKAICEDLRAKFEQYGMDNFSFNESPRIFIGITQLCPENICPANELMEKIDKAASHAKEMGQNPVFVFE